MTFDEVIEEFMSNVETDKKGGTPVTYKRKIYVFQEYVILKLEAKDVNFQSVLRGMTKEQLVDSLKYYVENYDIRYVSTVETYITVIGVFFDFIASFYQWNILYGKGNNYVKIKLRSLLKQYGYKRRSPLLLQHINGCLRFYRLEVTLRGGVPCSIEEVGLDQMLIFRVI